MNKQFEVFTLNNRISEQFKFTLTPLELKDFIDFEVKRAYLVSNSELGETSQHCHLQEKELFVMVQGTCSAVIDKGTGIEEIKLTGPKNAIYVPNYVWHGFKNLSPDAIILALSSTNYKADRSDYIENYDEYLKIRNEKLGQ
jgi:dTDP-4-dehydrorhamnose 3,5-epimerase-like enzyme